MESVNGEKKKRCCTLRQFSLVLAIITFIVTGVVTFGSILAWRHINDALNLVASDLAEEDEKHANSFYYNEKEQYKSNTRLLQHSENHIKVLMLLLSAFTAGGFLNLITSGFMVYGIAVRSPRCISPWLGFSGISYMLIVIFFIFTYLGMVLDVYISFNLLIAAFLIFLIFIIIWSIMLLNYKHLMSTTKDATTTPSIFQAYGGYFHKIDWIMNEQKVIV